MTDKQPEALRLADCLTNRTTLWNDKATAAAELRRLHEENLQWQEKCNTYMELHDAVVKDSDRLYALNAELVEALTDLVNEIGDGFMPHKLFVDQALAALAKSQGDNNEI